MNAAQARLGFVASRLEGTDGVSLETAKWVEVLNAQGHECFCLCGVSNWQESRTHLVPEAHFLHQDIARLDRRLFEERKRDPETTAAVAALKEHFKQELRAFVRRFEIDILVSENILSLPMNLPLGLALTEFIGETGVPVIAHHHDFWWNRVRYANLPIGDWLEAAFPPAFLSVRHVAINSLDAQELAFRKGVQCTLIPNVMDFDHPPPPPGEYARDLRSELGIAPDEFFLLQPTRVVPRKRVEMAIELVRRLEMPAVLVVTHTSGDEGTAYLDYLRWLADSLKVRMIFSPERFDYRRGLMPDGRKIYSLADAYHEAALVTYPSALEGFGNAFLETVYYRRPVVMDAYEIFKRDILPKGFRVITFQEFVDQDAVAACRKILREPLLAADWTDENFTLGLRHYSYRVLAERLNNLVQGCLRGRG